MLVYLQLNKGVNCEVSLKSVKYCFLKTITIPKHKKQKPTDNIV